jgi:putative hydrolase of the HAD superfamily
MGKGLKAILFDFGQTLVDSANGFRCAERKIQGRIMADLGVCEEGFRARYREMRTAFHASARLSRVAFWTDVYMANGREPNLQLLKDWEREYWEEVNIRTSLFPEALEVLENVGQRYRLGLVTNSEGSGAAHRLTRFPELERRFEVIIVAGEAGMPAKPDPAPFRACLQRLGVDAASAVYVGDDWIHDICGAAAAGLKPIWLQHRSTDRTWPAPETPVPIVTTLHDLSSVLCSCA